MSQASRPNVFANGGISPLGFMDHSPFGDERAELAYAETRDGVLLHIDQLGPARGMVFICPVCGGDVGPVRGPKVTPHFRHRVATKGCGGPETNAHIWAKAVLERVDWIKLPAVTLEGDKKPFIAEKNFRFDRVRPEVYQAGLIPDLVVERDDRRTGETRTLWIEIRVTHAVGPDKKEKIAERKQATVEIDLSKLRKCKDADVVRDAFLKEADRHWLYNDREAEEIERRRLLAEAAAAQAMEQRLRRAKALLKSGQGIVVAPTAALELLNVELNEFGLGSLLDGEITATGFCVPAVQWQAAIWARLVLAPLKAGKGAPVLEPFKVLEEIADCLAPGFRKPVGKEIKHQVAELAPGFKLPQDAIIAYFNSLAQQDFFVSRGFPNWALAGRLDLLIERRIKQLATIAERREVLVERVRRLCDEDWKPPFDIQPWLDRPCLDDRSPTAFMKGSREDWEHFLYKLRLVERMVEGGAPVANSLGLPVEADQAKALERERQAKEEAEAVKAAEAVAAALSRQSRIENSASLHLGLDAANAWLDAATTEGPSRRQACLDSEIGYNRISAELWLHVERLTVEAAREAKRQGNFEKLWQAVRKVFDPAGAKLFVDTTFPKLGYRTPRVASEDEAGLKASLALVPRKPQRQHH